MAKIHGISPTVPGTPRKSAIQSLEALLEEAYSIRASDIHIEPIEESVRIRMRVDGALIPAEALPRALHGELVSHIKVLAGLRTDEHRRPQDGRFRHILRAGAVLDARIATTPTYFGEKIVLRLLFPAGGKVTLEQLGMDERDQRIARRALIQSHGLILAAGPTGSGKTSTLYALLHLLAAERSSIVTIEDPIEYAIPAITQIQINEQTGLTFETGLRSILRLDPDTIMVGEVRDPETARLAVNAALTGHLVLSSIHTNDAPTALLRLLDLSVEPYLIPSTVQLIIAQRLVRRICSACRVRRALSAEDRQLLLSWIEREHCSIPDNHYLGAGCAACAGTGYRGRVGIFELLPMNERTRELIHSQPSASELRQQVCRLGMRTLLAAGMEKVAAGDTTLAEVLRLSHE